MEVVLHSAWLDGGLAVWGKRDEFARGVAMLLPRHEGRVERFVARVPLCHGEMAGGRLTRAAEGEATPGDMEVAGIRLAWHEAFEVLQRVEEGVRFGRGVFGGATFLRWREVFVFAGALVARGRYLPGVREVGGGFESRWMPALDYAEHVRLDALIGRMPEAGVCLFERAESRDALAQIAEGVRAFLELCVDRLVRAASVTRLSRVHAETGRYYSVHDAWISSLRGDVRVIRWANARELAALKEEADWWQRPVVAGSRAVSQWTVELEAPATAGGTWRLRARAATAPDEAMLTALGQAAKLCPFLQGAEVSLTTLEAHQFLRTYAPVLEAAGFAVVAPEWWRGGRVELGIRARMREEPTGRVSGFFAAENLVNVDWEVVLGGEAVTQEELAALTASGEPLAWWRGRWVEVDKGAVREAMRMWRRKGEALGGQDFTRLLLGVDEAAHGLRVVGVEANAWLQRLMKELRGGGRGLDLPRMPEGFVGELRPYQARGFAWLMFLRQWGLGACLADDMGLGKTVQALTMVQKMVEEGQRGPVLLVCPMSVMTNWLREAARFTPGLRVVLHHGAQRAVGESFTDAVRGAHVVVTSYHLLYRDYPSLRRVKWGGLVYDEAQNLKNPDTRQSQAARALTAETRVALTGTPMENHAGDLWSLMDILNPGLLGTRKSFREKFMRPIQTGVDVEARERLKQIVQPFVLRRHKLDPGVADDLPAKREAKVFCRLTKEQAVLYRDVLADFEREMKSATGAAKRGMIFGVLTRLKQVCNHPAQLLREGALADRSGKLERLEEMLEEMLEAGEAALIFTQYAEMGALLQRHVRETFGVETPFLHGGVSRKERDRMVADFQSENGPPVFVLSLRAGGTGLNLTRATQVFHYDRWWNPAVEDQATDRAFRIGQTRNVMVHKFITASTLEDHIDELIESKVALADELIGNGESWVAKLSGEKLAGVLRLSQEEHAE